MAGIPRVRPAHPAMLPLLLLLPSVLGHALPCPPGGLTLGSPCAPHRGGLIASIDDWTEGFARRKRAIGAVALGQIRTLLIDLRGFGRTSAGHRVQAARALLDLHGAGSLAARTRDAEREAEGWALQDLAAVEFASLLDEDVARWAAREILVVQSGNPPPRRAAAARLLSGVHTREVRLALTICIRGSLPLLAEAAAQALVGWKDEAVHQLFSGLLARADPPARPAILGAAEHHFRRVRLAPTDRVVPDLETYVRMHVGAEPWRSASRAVSVSRALPDPVAVPLLIDALEAWGERARSGARVTRVPYDLSRELAHRSGLELGLHVDRWRTWWGAVESGQVDPGPRRTGEGFTETSFFGLRPGTGRVVFVLDNSGSMGQIFRREGQGTFDAWTRYRESIEQMVDFLESLGPEARFGVVLFNDGTERWRTVLQPATAGHLKAARAWCLRRKPKGGTQLRHGVQRAMEVRPGGTVDLEHLEADTLIVLCDGRTSDGSRWALPFLRRENPLAQVVIHCVQIGSGGDGTLELLARTTGGDFVRVEN